MDPMTKIKGLLTELRDDDSGQAMVESAIIFPLYIAVVCIIIETAVLANTYFITDYAAYCAARAGIVHMGELEPMMIAASVALSPVTTSEIAPVRLMNTTSPTGNSAATLLTASAAAFLQFGQAISAVEYGIDGLLRGGAAGITRTGDDTIEGTAVANDSYISINQLSIMLLNSEGGGGGGLMTDPQYGRRTTLSGPQSGLVDAKGDGASGHRYTVVTVPSTIKKLRLRVQVSHSHSYLFPALPFILSLIARDEGFLGFGGGTGINLEDDYLQVLSGRITIRGFATMRMQSNLIQENISEAKHDEIHALIPPNPFD